MKKRTPQRTCVGCRKIADRNNLIRIVCSPEGTLIPDLKVKLPGRGAYVCSDVSCIKKAMRKGLLSNALKKPVEINEGKTLEMKIKEALERNIHSFLGILMKGKMIVVGRESIKKSFKRNEVSLLIQSVENQKSAGDRSDTNIPVRVHSTRERLGHAVGKGPQPLLAILDERGGKELMRLIDMKNKFDLGGGE